MAGTSAGGQRAKEKNIAQYGENYYAMIGAKGGSKRGIKKGFALIPGLAQEAGRKGGTISRRIKPTHCPQGHELTPENKYQYGKSYQCKPCRNNYERRKRAEKKAGLR